MRPDLRWEPVGGVIGPKAKRATPQEVLRAKKAIAAMPQARTLDGIYKKSTIVIMGNSITLRKMDLTPLMKFVTIGCNRGLRMYPWPEYLMVGDREPFCQERDDGRYKRFTEFGGVLLGTDSLFQPEVLLRGPYSEINRRAQPPPDFRVHVYMIGAKHINLDSFKRAVASCQNVSGSLIQAAAIMGANRIISVGIELKWPEKGESHCFPWAAKLGAHRQRISIPTTQRNFYEMKEQFRKRGVEFLNLSPVKKCPFADVWGNYPYEKFVGKVGP